MVSHRSLYVPILACKAGDASMTSMRLGTCVTHEFKLVGLVPMSNQLLSAILVTTSKS